ncbi:hypothetical protein MKQ68_25315 [Chitinophaga horti]|uniref:Uncharacterized protein n=1 Tax=Chitinophaga horti TaxID=2920382 RepID=A0ABY6J194_9BACT|nr:hypothetical protein [Chitinophaga horti]UYQ93405.1 hypothetical protein MKQ68_25315 [Chitinophaga horti]
MDEKLLKEAEELRKQAKSTGKANIKYKLVSGNDQPLAKVIKTQAQADAFMKLLKSL